MKLKLLATLMVCLCCIMALPSMAQTRYADSVFASYTMSTVTYSTVYSQQMDIYQPTGDTASRRPVLLLAHGGSFTSGTRTDDNTITQLCSDFAHKGYVTISIDYRLTPQANLLIGDSAITAVLEAVSDGKAALRYLHEYADSLKLDTSNIFIGGNSAGAVLFMQVAYIESLSQLTTHFQALLQNVGGLDGNSGNPGYSTGFKGVINLAGALNTPNWLSYCSKPVVSAQGDADAVVPYNCGNPYGFVPVTLCGLGALQPFIASNTPYWASMVFPGDGHVPWQGDATKFYRIDTMITNFLVKALGQPFNTPCTGTPYTSITEVSQANVSLYPNPATDLVNITSSSIISNITVYDATGREVAQHSNINNPSYQLNTSRLSAGVYTISVSAKESSTPAMRKIVIE